MNASAKIDSNGPALRETPVSTDAQKAEDALVRVEHLSRIYGEGPQAVQALADLSLTIPRGQFLTVLGPSGCGKSTLLNTIAGFDHPTSGRILVNGAPVSEPSPTRGVVFQDSAALFPWLTVRKNIEFGMRASGRPAAEIRTRTDAVLELVGLRQFADKFPRQLSGGMRQFVAMARVLVMDAQLLLMDEPFAALDAINRQRMQEQLTEIWARTRTTILFITHSVDEAVYLGDRVVVMSGRPGSIRADIPIPLARPRDLASDEFNSLRAQTLSFLR